jgi:hypothetical protein
MAQFWYVIWLPATSDKFRVRRGFLSHAEALRWVRGENIHVDADEYEIKKEVKTKKNPSRSRRNSPVKIRRVGGAQAEMALKDLGLIKVDAASAERLFNADVKFFITNTNVNSYHFFKGWHLASEIDPAKYKGENWTFKQMVNNWSYYNENAEMGKAAFFVSKGLVS